MKRVGWCSGALVLFFIMALDAQGGSRLFDEAAAFQVESVAPVLNNDVHQAHRQALSSGFRQALSKALAETGMGDLTQERSTALVNPDRYIYAYQIEEQSRRDLFYRLRMLIWINRPLLMKEVRSDGSALPRAAP